MGMKNKNENSSSHVGASTRYAIAIE